VNLKHYCMCCLSFSMSMLKLLISVHRFSNDTMPWFNIIKKWVSQIYWVRYSRLTFWSSSHYHFLSGVLLAADMYRAKFSASSPYIVNTIRDNEKFLWICTGVWAVSSIYIYFPISPQPISPIILVRRNLKPPHPLDSSLPEARRQPQACHSSWIRLQHSLSPQLLLREHGLGGRLRHDRQSCR